MENIKIPESKEKRGDVTLYNFGYAPKEVIEKFQYFCCQYSSLSEAIHSLLKREKCLKYRYRFIVSPITHQMLARPTKFDQPDAVRYAMVQLYKCMKQCRYTSVADVIEELLCSLPEGDRTCIENGSETEQNVSVSPSSTLTKVEQEALAKIADAVIYKLQLMQDPKKHKKLEKNEPYKKTSKKTVSLSKKSSFSKEKTSPNKQKTKFQKVCDPEYLPTKQKCLWKKSNNESFETSSVSFNQALLPSSSFENTVYPDIELLMPLQRLSSSLKPDIKNIAARTANASRKSKYLFKHLHLISHSVLHN